MNRKVTVSTRMLKGRTLAKALACGSLLLVLPACQIPCLKHPEAAPELPADFNLATNGVAMPVVGQGPPPAANMTIKAAAKPPANPPAAGETIKLASATAATPISGATLTPVAAVEGAAVGGVATATLPAVTPPALAAACATSSAQLSVEEFYNDPLLTGLIRQAAANNRELKALDQEVQVASYEVLARRGAYLPVVTVGAGGGFEKTARATRDGAVEEQLLLPPRGRTFPDPLPNTRVGLDVFWNLDIWRAFRNARDAAFQRYLAAAERRNAFVTRMVADVAEDYFELMALDKRMENLDQTIALQQQSLEAAKARVDAVRGNTLAVQRFEAEVRRNQSERQAIKQDIVQAENRINVLLNRYPQPVERSATGFYDLTIHALSVGLPAQLLQNRPDVRQAERELAAAGLDLKVARTRFYPALTLQAGVGYEAFNPRYLFNPEAFAANVAGNLVAPLVNKAAIQAEYGSANARQLQAVYNYQRVVLNAFTEVVNRVSMAENYRKSVDLRKQQMQALEASVEAATKLFQNARVEYTEVLFTQRDLRDARMGLIDAKVQELRAVVNAYQALGGGNVSPTPVQAGPTVKPATSRSFLKHGWWKGLE